MLQLIEFILVLLLKYIRVIYFSLPEKIVEPLQNKNRTKWYHRKFPRVLTIDQCEVEDPVCIFEAQEQYRRDKYVIFPMFNEISVNEFSVIFSYSFVY